MWWCLWWPLQGAAGLRAGRYGRYGQCSSKSGPAADKTWPVYGGTSIPEREAGPTCIQWGGQCRRRWPSIEYTLNGFTGEHRTIENPKYRGIVKPDQPRRNKNGPCPQSNRFCDAWALPTTVQTPTVLCCKIVWPDAMDYGQCILFFRILVQYCKLFYDNWQFWLAYDFLEPAWNPVVMVLGLMQYWLTSETQ